MHQHFNPRSPHGERRSSTSIVASSNKFQSTLPARGATRVRNFVRVCNLFQSTLPARGATGCNHCISREHNRISIHAPRTGSDLSHVALLLRLYYFNPRSPHGERPCPIAVACGKNAFQSTLPARGATERHCSSCSMVDISIHAPRTGSDWMRIRYNKSTVNISIHAPRTGSDAFRSR